MKKLLTVFIFFVLCPLSFAEDIYPNEIGLEQYLNDFNVQSYKTKKQERFKKTGFNDYQKKDDAIFEEGKFSISSKAKETKDSKYLIDELEHNGSLNYEGNRFKLSAGAYSSHARNGATKGTEEVFFSPKLNLSKRVSLELNNRIDARGDYFTQEVGLRYKTKYLKNGSVGVSGGSKFHKNSTRSDKLKFSTEFYLF